jgi:cytochrome c oxidase subunit II
MVGLVVALAKRRTHPADPVALDPRPERTRARVVGALIGLTAVILVSLTFLSYVVDRAIADRDDAALTIRITGHQWWWEVTYEDPQPSRVLTVANEIHIPTDVPVRLALTSSDVIHSFWVPKLMGKQDLITGRHNLLRLVASEPGVFRGQCAEFCGMQHAHMALLVVAEPPEVFAAWREAQLKPAQEPSTDEARAGREVFLNGPCMMCHQIRGTSAGGRTGPDLTHVASNLYIVAGTLRMTRGNLAAWIADPQGIKPGAHMPTVPLDPHQLNALVAYLEVLK